MTSRPNQEHPLANILINVLIPVLALSYLSKDGHAWWNLGALRALYVALIPPLAYGIWFFVKTRKANAFSILGLASVALTGGITLYLWNDNGTIKPQAALFFGLKEAAIPLILGVCVLVSHRTASPLLRTFLYSDSIFSITTIETKVAELSQQAAYNQALWQATKLFSCSFFLSAALNLGLSYYFLGSLDTAASNAREIYNAQVAKITGWGFLVIGVPLMVFMFFTLHQLLRSLRSITQLSDEQLLLPR